MTYRQLLMNNWTRILRSPADDGGAPAGDPPAGDPPADDKPAGDPPADDKPAGDPPAGDPPADDKPPVDPATLPPETYTFTPPEGVEIDAKAVELATPVFKELGLTNDAANKVVGLYASQILPGVVTQVQSQVLTDFGLVGFDKWSEQALVDPRLGGAPGKPISEERLGQVMADVARFRDTFGTPELTALLDSTTLGNHPEILAAFASAGKAIGEGEFHRSDNGAPADVPLERSLYGDAFAPKR